MAAGHLAFCCCYGSSLALLNGCKLANEMCFIPIEIEPQWGRNDLPLKHGQWPKLGLFSTLNEE